MDNTKEVLQSLIEHEITYSRSAYETEKLWKFYHALSEQPSKSVFRIPKLHHLLATGVIGFIVAYLFTHLPSVTNW